MTSRATAWRRANPERAREISRASYQKRTAEGRPNPSIESRRRARVIDPMPGILKGIKAKCLREGIAFNLIVEDLQVPTHCPVLGVELVLDQPRHRYGPSVDRVNPAGGYVRGNVRVISMRANRLKQDSTLTELQALVKYVEEHLALSESYR